MGYGVPDSGVDFIYITPREAYLLMKNDKAVFVDARDGDNYEATHLQTSFHLSANDLIFNKSKIDMSVVELLKEQAAKGRTIVALSDACITGARNRGHVSRCRHVAQYLVELGCDRQRIVRMTGGINAWKDAWLDGVMADLRPMFAGRWVEAGFRLPDEAGAGEEDEKPQAEVLHTEPLKQKPAGAEAAAAADPEPDQPPPELAVGCTVEITGLKSRPDLNGKKGKVLEQLPDAGRWEVEVMDEGKERVRCKPDNIIVKSGAKRPSSAVSVAEKVELPTTTVCCGGNVAEDGQEAKIMCEVIDVPPRAFKVDTPTAYRVLKGDIYKKPSKDSDKIIKLERPVCALVRTTGQVYQGANGGKWAELDVTAGEKKGWVYIEGPGFGPSSRKIRSEYLRA